MPTIEDDGRSFWKRLCSSLGFAHDDDDDILLCCIAELGVILRPMIVSVTYSTAKVSFSPPAGASSSKALVYIIKYRKVRSCVWKSTKEFRGLRRTVTGLDANSQYEFKVVARYHGASSAVESNSVMAKTKQGTCKCISTLVTQKANAL